MNEHIAQLVWVTGFSLNLLILAHRIFMGTSVLGLYGWDRILEAQTSGSQTPWLLDLRRAPLKSTIKMTVYATSVNCICNVEYKFDIYVK